MLKRTLEEFDEADVERATRVGTDVAAREFRVGGFSQKLLYPELKLEPPYTYCIGTIPAAQLLPLYKTVIVDVRPLPNEAMFERRYGLSVEQFTKYVEQGRIAMRLRTAFKNFVGLTYLDELLKRQPPISGRFSRLNPTSHESNLDDGLRLCPTRDPVSQAWTTEYTDWDTRPAFRDVFAAKYALVSSHFGGEEAARIVHEAIRQTGDAGAAYDWLHVFSRLRVYPHTHCLDGVNTLSIKDWTSARAISTTRRIAPPHELPPFEVGRALLLNLPLDLPKDLDRAMKAPPAAWMEVVHALDAELCKDKPDGVAALCERLTALTRDTNKEVEGMRKRQSKIESTGLTLSGLGIVGALADLAGPEWKAIIGFASGAAGMLRGRIAETVVKFKKPGHVVAWFELRKRLD